MKIPGRVWTWIKNKGLKRVSAHSELGDPQRASRPAHRQPPSGMIPSVPPQWEVTEKNMTQPLKGTKYRHFWQHG